MIYIDNSATTKQYPQVTETMLKYMEEYFGNPSSMYQLGLDSEKAVKHARKQVEEAMGAGNGSLVFTSGGTEADNTAIFGAARALRRRGNKIITSAVEHPAVLECCRRLEQDGYDVVYIGVDGKCRLDLEQLEDAIDENTILVSLMQVNNEAGTIMPVDAVKDLMKKKNALVPLRCGAELRQAAGAGKRGSDLGQQPQDPRSERSRGIVCKKGRPSAGAHRGRRPGGRRSFRYGKCPGHYRIWDGCGTFCKGS